MDFPAYVPAGAREHIRYTLEGSAGPGGFVGVNAFVREYTLRPDTGDALAWLQQEQACVNRFAHDPRMQAVYAELQKVVTDDEQYRVLLAAAFTAVAALNAARIAGKSDDEIRKLVQRLQAARSDALQATEA